MLKWHSFTFIFHRGNRKIGWVGDKSCFLSKKIPGEKGSNEGVFLQLIIWLEILCKISLINLIAV
jgi:hypothetical protein